MANQSCWMCMGCPFQTFENTIAANTALMKIAVVDISPLNLFVLPGMQAFIKKASRGNNAAAMA